MTKVVVILRDGTPFEVKPQGQLFTFQAVGGRQIIICVPKLVELRAQYPDKWETIDVDIVPADARLIDETRGINRAQLRNMPRQRVDEPGIGVFQEDGSFLVVDGNHRYCKRANLGEKSMLFHACWSPHWHAALINLSATVRAWD
jgi:hypothetical protein